MKLKKNINILLIISKLVVLITLNACMKNVHYYDGDVDCTRCFEDYPDIAKIELTFNINRNFSEVIYHVYAGYAESSPIIFTDTVTENTVFVYLDSDEYYSFLAEYYDIKNDRYIYVISDCYPKPLKVRSLCDYECYYIEDAYVDLRHFNR